MPYVPRQQPAISTKKSILKKCLGAWHANGNSSVVANNLLVGDNSLNHNNLLVKRVTQNASLWGKGMGGANVNFPHITSRNVGELAFNPWSGLFVGYFPSTSAGTPNNICGTGNYVSFNVAALGFQSELQWHSTNGTSRHNWYTSTAVTNTLQNTSAIVVVSCGYAGPATAFVNIWTPTARVFDSGTGNTSTALNNNAYPFSFPKPSSYSHNCSLVCSAIWERSLTIKESNFLLSHWQDLFMPRPSVLRGATGSANPWLSTILSRRGS